jgi:hypothetical protein
MPESWLKLKPSDRWAAASAAAQYHQDPGYYSTLYSMGYESDPKYREFFQHLKVYVQYSYGGFQSFDEYLQADSFRAFVAKADLAHQELASGKIDKWEFLRKLAPAAIGMGMTQAAEGAAGLFSQNGIRTTNKFWTRLEETGYSEAEAFKAYTKGNLYTHESGDLIRWDQKLQLAVRIDPQDGGVMSVWHTDHPSSNWTRGGVWPWLK